MLVVTVVPLACAILLDSLLLLCDPPLYRRCEEYIEEQLGWAWMTVWAVAFLTPGCVFLLHGLLDKAVGCVLMSVVSLGVGAFFALAAGERFAHLAEWWRCRSDAQFRLAGAAGILLSIWMLVLALQLGRG